jgi:hypothetical protein
MDPVLLMFVHLQYVFTLTAQNMAMTITLLKSISNLKKSVEFPIYRYPFSFKFFYSITWPVLWIRNDCFRIRILLFFLVRIRIRILRSCILWRDISFSGKFIFDKKKELNKYEDFRENWPEVGEVLRTPDSLRVTRKLKLIRRNDWLQEILQKILVLLALIKTWTWLISWKRKIDTGTVQQWF